MKKITLISIILFMFVGMTLSAQQPRPRAIPEDQAKRRVERLNKELQLTDKQQKQLTDWFTESEKKRKENFEKAKDNRDQLRQVMDKARTENEAKLKEILTAEQYTKYQNNQKKRMEEMQQRMSNRRQVEKK